MRTDVEKRLAKLEKRLDELEESVFGLDDSPKDELYPRARQIVVQCEKVSSDLLQRKLGIGYARAMRMLDYLEDEGILGPANGSESRVVLGKQIPS